MENTFKLKNPEIEAEIYYLTSEEGGRWTPIFNGYRGQFYYDGNNSDAPQEFIDKNICNPGEKVKVKLQTASPKFHIGKLWIGKEFETREGSRIVGRGKITKLIRNDFEFWNYESTIKNLPKNCVPYDDENIEGFIVDFEYALEELEEIQKIDCKVDLSNQDEMIVVKCKLLNNDKSSRPPIEKIYKCWEEQLSFEHHKYKIDWNRDFEKIEFELSFITWHSMYLTGKIIL